MLWSVSNETSTTLTGFAAISRLNELYANLDRISERLFDRIDEGTGAPISISKHLALLKNNKLEKHLRCSKPSLAAWLTRGYDDSNADKNWYVDISYILPVYSLDLTKIKRFIKK